MAFVVGFGYIGVEKMQSAAGKFIWWDLACFDLRSGIQESLESRVVVGAICSFLLVDIGSLVKMFGGIMFRVIIEYSQKLFNKNLHKNI